MVRQDICSVKVGRTFNRKSLAFISGEAITSFSGCWINFGRTSDIHAPMREKTADASGGANQVLANLFANTICPDVSTPITAAEISFNSCCAMPRAVDEMVRSAFVP